MKLLKKVTGRELSRHIRPIFLRFGLVPAEGPDMAEGRSLAAQLIGGEIVSPATLERVQAYTGCAVFVAHEEGALTGVLAWVYLNQAGEQAVHRGEFDVFDPAEAHMASPDEVVCGVYGWGIAASTKATAKRLGAASEAGEPLASHVPRFARAVTDAGRRFLCDRFGYAELPGSDGLVWMPPLARAEPAEAA